MNIERFSKSFKVTSDEGNPTEIVAVECADSIFSAIINLLGGKTFQYGLYRVLRADQIGIAKDAMEKVFPEYAGNIVPFAFDWLGRHFAVDLRGIQNGLPQVLMLEVGAGEAMQIPGSIEDFHNIELVEYADDALSVPFWQQWRESNPHTLLYSECVGYKIPLFLGGTDMLSNLEIIDLSIYVEICGQLRNKTRCLPVGQTIRQVSIS